MEEVPRRTSLAPLAFLCFVLCFSRGGTEGLFDYQGREGIISIVRWNLRPVICGAEKKDPKHDPKRVRKLFSPSQAPYLIKIQGPPNKGVSNGGGGGGVSRSGLVLPFFVLCPFWDFPDFAGIFPICPGTLRGVS